ISGTDEPQAPRNIRLGSFLPMGSRTSDAFSDDNHDHFVGVWHCRFKTPKFLKRMRFPSTFEPHSKTYVTWLFLVALAFMYNAVVIPLRGVFPYQTDDNVRYWMIVDYICDLIYIVDILVFKVRVRFANNGIVETDWYATKRHYTKKWMFKFDLLSLLPLDFFYLIDSVGINPWLRLPRVLKIQTYWEFYERCDQASRSSAHAIRIIKTMCYMLFLIHIETCGYYAMSIHEGIGINAWVYDGRGIAYIRCFYLAVKTATSIGNNPDPTNEKEYIFMTFYWLSGVFVFALLIGQIRDIVEAAGMVKDNYRKKMDACHWYMQSINLPKEMKDRVRQWFLYNWNQQKTIDERSLVVSLPKKLQTDLAINVHFNTLSKVQLFQDCERNLLYDLVLKLKPILYLPGDYICQKGEVGKEMYIVTQGQVEVVGGENNTTVLATLHEGSVFGEISLLAMSGRGNRRTADVRSKGYTNVFTLSKHDFEMAMTEYPDAQAVLKKRAKKLLKANAKMEKKHKKVEAEEIIKSSPETPKLLQTVIQIMDPDSNVVKQLTPSVRRSQRSFKRPHSRQVFVRLSHSYRLSPTTANVHHLTPPRSHSYRMANKTSCEILTPVLGHDRVIVSPDKDGYDTDEENDEPMVADSSDDVSLSEVLHDAGVNSSFEDDEEDDDDMLMNDNYKKNRNRPNSSTEIWDGEKDKRQEKEKEGKREVVSPGINKQQMEPSNRENVHESDHVSFVRNLPERSWLDQDIQTGGHVDTCQESLVEQTIIDNNGNETPSSTLKGPNGHITPVRCNMLQPDDSMEDYIEKQKWPGNNGKNLHENGHQLNVSSRMEKLAPPPLVMPSCSVSTENPDNGSSRHRKLSVVTPPVSPASPRDKPANQNWASNYSPRSPASPLEKVNSHWAYNPQSPASPRDLSGSASWNKTYNLHSPISPNDKPKAHWSTQGQIINKRDSTSPSSFSGSGHEAIPIIPLPPVETVIVKNNRLPENPHHIGVKGSVLTNGLEGCCGSGPLVDIPPENRITCSVEIHRQKSITSSSTDIHGHTETML
ncbi:cyclic nucleotide-gated cation channel beta-1, partial [Biomphalaria pfeifferi]